MHVAFGTNAPFTHHYFADYDYLLDSLSAPLVDEHPTRVTQLNRRGAPKEDIPLGLGRSQTGIGCRATSPSTFFLSPAVSSSTPQPRVLLSCLSSRSGSPNGCASCVRSRVLLLIFGITRVSRRSPAEAISVCLFPAMSRQCSQPEAGSAHSHMSNQRAKCLFMLLYDQYRNSTPQSLPGPWCLGMLSSGYPS